MYNDSDLDISVVIGFKDWGLERLELSIKSLNRAFGSLQGEVVVSDFGSDNWEPIRELAERLGAVYHRTPNAIGWSRSRAINAGYAQSRGRILVATDADMLFSPRSMELIANRIDEDPNLSIVLQCRDLPEGYSHESPDVINQNWETFETVSQIRPRWGMGGMFAATRERVMNVGGYDNRMHTYGGEDLDFAQRIRRSGSPLLWIEDPEVRMYHIWHPPTIRSVGQTAEGTAAIEFNRSILKSDNTWKRNNQHSDWNIEKASSSCSILVRVTDGKHLLDTVVALLNQRNCNLDIQILTSTPVNVKMFTQMMSHSNHSIRVIEKDSFQELVTTGLNQAGSPFVTLVTDGTFLGETTIEDSLNRFYGSTAASFALTLPLDSTQPEQSIQEDHWTTPQQVLANSFVVCKTNLARAIDPVEDNVRNWNASLANSIILLGGELVSIDSMSVLTLSERNDRFDSIPQITATKHEIFSLPLVVKKSPTKNIEKLFSELLPNEVYARGALLSASNRSVGADILESLPELVSWSMITDQTAAVVEFEAFIPSSSPAKLDHFRSLGLSVEHLSTSNIRQKHLLASIASRTPADHAFRHILNFETADRVGTVFAVIFGDEGEEMNLEHMSLVMDEGDIFRNVNVDGKQLNFLARKCSSPESISSAKTWLELIGKGLRKGFVAAGNLDVFTEIMKNKEGSV